MQERKKNLSHGKVILLPFFNRGGIDSITEAIKHRLIDADVGGVANGINWRQKDGLGYGRRQNITFPWESLAVEDKQIRACTILLSVTTRQHVISLSWM